jgi:hypothetical protein
VPIFNDASVGNPANIGGDEIDRLTLALDLPEASGEVTAETQVRDDTIAGRNHLLDLTTEVRDCGAHGYCENFTTTPTLRPRASACVRERQSAQRGGIATCLSIGRDEYRRHGNSAVRAGMDGAGEAHMS